MSLSPSGLRTAAPSASLTLSQHERRAKLGARLLEQRRVHRAHAAEAARMLGHTRDAERVREAAAAAADAMAARQAPGE